MHDRATVSLDVMVDLKLNDGVDISSIKDIINGLQVHCNDSTGKSGITGVTVIGRNLVVDTNDEPDAE